MFLPRATRVFITRPQTSGNLCPISRNYGLRVFAQTDQGLCIGTANPFYGTQVWLLRNSPNKAQGQ